MKALAVPALAAAMLLSAPGASASACRYDVVPDASEGFEDLTLRVAIDCDGDVRPGDFRFDYGARPFVEWRDGAGLAYDIRLGAMARSRSPSDFAATSAGVLAPLAAWIAAPGRDVEKLRISVAERAGVYSTTNLSEEGGRLTLARRDWRFGGYSTFAGRPPLRATAPGPGAFPNAGRVGPRAADVRIALLDDDFAMKDGEFVAVFERFAGIVARYWAGFPSDRLLVAITPGGRRSDPFGRVRGGGGATMMLRISRNETPEFFLTRDWVLTHELIHLGAPFAPSRTPWFMEGMATYLEPLVRALGGATTRRAVWAEWLRAMPRGARDINRSGLDGGGHVYWTGALYFLMAHVELARRGDPDGLARCFRAMRDILGDAASRATVDQLIAICDRAVGGGVFGDLRARYATPADPDLTALWRELGVSMSGGDVKFDPAGENLRRILFDSAQFPPPAS